MTETKVILISGKKRAGKNHCAEVLKAKLEQMGKTVLVTAYADPIKEILAISLNISVEELDTLKNNNDVLYSQDENTEIWQLTGARSLIQKFGTEAMKQYFGTDVWVNLMKLKIRETDADFVIIPDFRFPSENISHLTIKVKNDGVDKVATDSHASETSLDGCESLYEVDNTGKPNLSPQVSGFILNVLGL